MNEDLEIKDSYTIIEIKNMVANGTIELPPIQRGFVWKPYQIENLWDSLLRGFPIGCFICKKTGDGRHIEILDGQQRLTSILLGLNWNNDQEESTYVKHIKEMQNEHKIFLDLERYEEDKNDHRKYNTRVITISHPWGYQRSPNNKILSYSDIIKAQDLIFSNLDKKEAYLTLEKRNILFEKGFPYDSCECINLTDFIKNGTYKETYKGHIDTKNKRIQLESLADNVLSTKISFQYINEDTGQTDHIPDGNNDEDLDSTEYLFTLINRGGTRVSNEDLNYSLIKNELMKDTVNGRRYIENIDSECKKIGISPSRFITICYFLHKAEKDGKVSLYVSPTEFKRAIKDDKNQEFLNSISGKNTNGEPKYSVSFFKTAEEIMVYNEKNNRTGIPYIWYLNILQQNIYLPFLICYLMNKKIKINIVPLITILAVFGYHKYQQQTLKKLVESFVKEIKNDEDMKKEGLFNFFKNHEDLITKPLSLEKIKEKCDKEEFYKHDNENDYSNNFGYYIKWEKELLLYAQRRFLAEQFGKEQYTLDDMNRPFDYDHIFPAKYRQRNKCQNWDTIGNFRAWPYNLNRGDGEKLPCIKFKKKDDKEKEFEEYDETLLMNSFCYDTEWYFGKNNQEDEEYFTTKFKTIQDLTNKSNREIAEDVIKKRILLIYKEWYEMLDIDAFFENNEEPQ